MTQIIETVEQLQTLYGKPGEASLKKVATFLTDNYKQLIESSPFCALATVGPEGLDCSPRGDAGTCVFIKDEKTLVLPDRRGNNRVDSLINIVRDPRVALMMLIPGSGTCIRVNGKARLVIEPAVLEAYKMENQLPRSVIEITVDEIYFQCARAVHRADLWNPDRHVGETDIPSPGAILQEMSQHSIDGTKYDKEWPERAAKTMW